MEQEQIFTPEQLLEAVYHNGKYKMYLPHFTDRMVSYIIGHPTDGLRERRLCQFDEQTGNLLIFKVTFDKEFRMLRPEITENANSDGSTFLQFAKDKDNPRIFNFMNAQKQEIIKVNLQILEHI